MIMNLMGTVVNQVCHSFKLKVPWNYNASPFKFMIFLESVPYFFIFLELFTLTVKFMILLESVPLFYIVFSYSRSVLNSWYYWNQSHNFILFELFTLSLLNFAFLYHSVVSIYITTNLFTGMEILYRGLHIFQGSIQYWNMLHKK